jgi:hypothetical protein
MLIVAMVIGHFLKAVQGLSAIGPRCRWLSVNELAEKKLFEILSTGTREEAYFNRGFRKVYDYRLSNGYGARFDIETGKMIGFLDPRL